MSTKLTILCENTVGRPGTLVGEHGFACLVETAGRSILFDTGQGLGIAANARDLEIDLQKLDGVVLSHGHYDHAGGLAAVLRVSGPVDVFCHRDVFIPRYWVSDHACRAIGLPHQREVLEDLGARFHFVDGFLEVAPRIHLSGEVPRVTEVEAGDPHLQVKGRGGEFGPDPLRDDLSLVVETAKGLVVVVGCAHAGLINILTHVRSRFPREKIHAVIGGTHLGPADDRQFEDTLKTLRTLEVEKIGLAHCTGQNRGAEMHARFPVATFFAAVGTVFDVP